MDDVISDEAAFSRVVQLIYQVNGLKPENIQLQDSLIRDLAMDSVELIDLLMRLEETGVTIPETDINSEITVGHIVRCVQTA